jgi:hypothetical protein
MTNDQRQKLIELQGIFNVLVKPDDSARDYLRAQQLFYDLLTEKNPFTAHWQDGSPI